MISDRELWASAQLILRQYGEQAIEHAANRAVELARKGDEAGIAVWCAIADRIGQLADTEGYGQSRH